jgi:uncharacterized protein
MKAREFDARRLDVRALAKAAGELGGDWPVAGFERLHDALAEPVPGGAVSWRVRGAEVPVRGGAAELWLHLRADAVLPLVCQRCLDPVSYPLVLERSFLFVADEARAAELDAEVEHDVLVVSRELDLHELLEDELLLELPLVPRHDHCPQPLAPGGDEQTGADPEHPFAALAGLRRGDA